MPFKLLHSEVFMKFRAILALITAFVLSSAVYASTESLVPFAEKAVSGSGTESAEAIRQLRASGPEGLKVLFETYASEINDFRTNGAETEKWRKIAAAIDAVAMQKDAYASALYWYSDLEAAKIVARKANKPVLTLRLLGNLDEEFSCANSRLFRSLLYSNTEISEYLRENYILHWKSVRPAPRITIDFGDGRKIERTITGNSIHYVLDDDGRVIEALPGLYSPKAFLIYLTQAKQVNDAIDGKDKGQQALAVYRYRKLSFDRIKAKRDQAIARTKATLTDPTPVSVSPTSARGAAPIAATKMVVTDEKSLLDVYDPFYSFEPNIDFSEWQKLADIYSPSPVFDEASTRFIRRQTAKTGLTDAEFDKMLAKVRSFVGLDTTRNDFLYHTQLYSWLNGENVKDLEAFNSRVYSELFKTPDSDKWLGLYSTDVYTALDGNGVIK